MRDIKRVKGVKCSAVVHGRLPLMVLESCIIRAGGTCTNYGEKSHYCGEYTDRITMERFLARDGRLVLPPRELRAYILLKE